MAQRFGYQPLLSPPVASRQLQSHSLAYAAAGRKPSNPWGLMTDTTDSARVSRGAGGLFGGAGPLDPAIATAITARKSPYGSSAQPPAQAPSVNPAAAAAAAQPQAPPVTSFDPNTDPALQQVYAFTGLSDEQARAGALKAKQQQLLDYGDPGLIRQTLGDETLATAAGQNPNSTLANYKTQRDRNITSDTENYNKQNLLYSGARIVGEQQSAQDYQNALGRLAAEQNQGLGAIDSGLAQALSENQRQRNEAMQAAYAQAMQEELLKALLGYGNSYGNGGNGSPEAPYYDPVAYPLGQIFATQVAPPAPPKTVQPKAVTPLRHGVSNSYTRRAF